MAEHADEHSEEPEEERDEEAEAQDRARRRLALAQIRQYPDRSLRLRAHEIDRFDADLKRLAGRMTLLMRDAHGVGLAATQVGVLQRLFVFQASPDDEPQVVVNPRIVARGDETASDDEGCLSLQGVLVPVERNVAVTLEGTGIDGVELRLELADLAARVVQHELDHLDGVLILDRTDPDSRRRALATLRPTPRL
jgi:peptide deformylase